ncbi:MAG: GrpB family protein [Candidatus Parcubacteria bacterium]|nr:GrpB family protein [Candidatus Parcubacteria bacterium]
MDEHKKENKISKFNRPNRSYHIETHDPRWFDEFAKRKSKLEAILGDIVVDIQHTGSTSVQGLIAKPQIDILVVVKRLDDIIPHYDDMEVAGFTPRGDYTHIGEEYFTEDDEQGTRLASIHILPVGHPEISAILDFRDYLRSNAKDRNLYAATKQILFKKFPDDYKSYDSGKTEVILAIKKRAKNWANQRGK